MSFFTWIIVTIIASALALISYIECHDNWDPITKTFWDNARIVLAEEILWTTVAAMSLVYLFTHLW